MSSYLLLRNNKESGPFTLEEVKGMALTTYDLLWVVGKSAAWRYPGEINELKAFAPPLPEQITNFNAKRSGTEIPSIIASNTKKPDSSEVRSRDNNSLRGSQQAVYVNLPSKREQVKFQSDRVLFDMDFSEPLKRDPGYSFSEANKKKSNSAVQFSAKIIWLSTIILLFGAGLLTGFFISDRRKFFSTDANPPQNRLLSPSTLKSKKGISSVTSANPQGDKLKEENLVIAGHENLAASMPRKASGTHGNKNLKKDVIKKDSTIEQKIDFSSLKSNDSIEQIAASKTEALYLKIKAHPENYINLTTGHYSTGVFGGISTFLVSVTNNSLLTMNQVIVSIDYIQTNEKIYKTENIAFNDLEPGETVSMKAPKSPRGVKITTRISLVNNKQLDPGASN